MTHPPHLDQQPLSLKCGIITVSDTRTSDTDRSGQLIRQHLNQAGHQVTAYHILPDEPAPIQALLTQLCTPKIDAIILSGGTGIAPRDTTYDALASMLEKTLPGFGEVFRMLSYDEIGSRAIASRAIAGVYHHTLLFSLPGSSNAVRLALEKLILPELAHLVQQLRGR
jgi:molybdenum cofactor biosynthesis protein B